MFENSGRRIMEIVRNAREGIDLFVAPVDDVVEGIDFLRYVNPQLRLRCLLGLSGSWAEIQNFSAQDDRLGCGIARYQRAGWTVQIVDRRPTIPWMIVDGQSVILAPWREPFAPRSQESQRSLLESAEESAMLASGFETHWEASRSVTQAYTDQMLETAGSTDQPLIVVSAAHWDGVISRLRQSPCELYTLPPRKFEELVAELLQRDGLRVKLTPRVKDGGFDIFAFAHTDHGDHLYLVECKRYSPEHPVGAEIVRSLYGIVEERKATAGLLVTTSRFTRGATAFCDRITHRMSLVAYRDFIAWLERVP